MATVSYNKKSQTFTVLWKDYAKEALGDKYPYSRKSKKWRGNKAPSSAEKRIIERELLNYAQREEHASKEKADTIRTHGNIEYLTAVGYLQNLTDEELTISDRKEEKIQARRIVSSFSDWLNKHHKGIALHRINSTIASQYYKYLQKNRYSYAYIKNIVRRLSYTFKQVIRRYEDSPLKYNNPFSTLRLDEVITKVACHKRKPYTDEQLQQFLLSCTMSYRLNKWELLQRFACFYFIIVTGWRVNDILQMKWKQIDLKKEVITTTHKKTENKGIETELGITNLMREILIALQKLQEVSPNEHKEFVFSLRGKDASIEVAPYASILKHFQSVRRKLNLLEKEKKGRNQTYSYTIHSFRGTVITRLTQLGYQEVKINYLVGHAPTNTEAKHYLTLEGKDTRPLVERIEKLCNADAIANEIEIIKQRRDEIQRQIDERKREEERQELLRKKELLEQAKATIGQAEWERMEKLHDEADKYFSQPERLAQENKMNELQQLIYRMHQALGDE